MLDPNRDDPEFLLLAEIATSLKGRYSNEKAVWAKSPFEWMKPIPASSQIGKIAEQLVAGCCEAKGLSVARCPDRQADLVIADSRVEVKYSSLWMAGVYKFQQIRDQDYNHCFCLGVSPFRANAWYIPKSELMKPLDESKEGLRAQHGGRQGLDTRWLSVDADSPPEWLASFGGTLSQVHELILEAVR